MAFCKRWAFLDELDDPTDDPRRRLAEVEDEEILLQDQLSKGLKQNGGLFQQINAQPSPLLRLPFDVLSEISLAAFPRDDIGAWGSDTPLLLGSICRTLREFTWATSKLWCTIPVNVFGRYRPSKVSLLKEWLSRSQKSPISIFLNLAKPVEFLDSDIMWDIMDIVAHCSERWYHISLDTPYFFDGQNCFIPEGFSQLHSLQILHQSRNFPRGLEVFEHAPVIRKVTLQAYMGILLPVNSLSHLRLEYAFLSDCLMLLQRHPNLTQCIFESIYNRHADGNELLQVVNAPSLQILDLTFAFGHYQIVTSLFDNISAPALHKLKLTMGRNPLPRHNFISFLERSSCQLSQFDIYECGSTEEVLVDCIAAMPSLTELGFRNIVGTYTMHSLTLDPNYEYSPAVLLPNLTHLSLTITENDIFDFAAFLKMVRSRRQPTTNYPEEGNGFNESSKYEHVAKINTITIKPLRRNAVEFIGAKIDQLREIEGLEVRVRTMDWYS
ncbi:hypothetical protein BDZ94DRAFT_961562 [Collybia nuda]|uniref:F-box domain-containing protein n=1 Tax=Collybia nuda TaxID=64659 RepID=A0A9P5YF54_9AGAR|nr:hypothetical protein BDZ94DRAFT_961562 [Collybia nuda]